MAATRKKSSLTNFEKLSPNRNKPRNMPVCRLTPHHVAGNLTALATLSLDKFQTYNPTNGSSSNYAIGSDGQIGLGVEETNRAWTSSSSTNDHQAITVEISNDGGAPDWKMSDDAINAWLDLATDICQFYGFSKVNYKEKPSNITIAKVENWIKTWAKDDEMIVTLHNWYSATACPGPYFMAQLPWLVYEMNKRLSGSIATPFVGGVSKIPDDDEIITVPDANIKSISEIAAEVIAGKWGNGPVREKNLTAAGYDYAIVQAEVNRQLGVKTEIIPPTNNSNVSYEITITAAALNVRKEASAYSAVVKTLVNDKNVYTIIKEKSGPAGNGANGLWGKLKSGIGWVLLAYTKKR